MDATNVNWEQAGNVAAVVSAVGVVLLLAIVVLGYAVYASRGGDDADSLLYRLAQRVNEEPALVTGAVAAIGVLLVQTEVLVEVDDTWANTISGVIVGAAAWIVRQRATPVTKVERSGFKYDKNDDSWKRSR